MIASNYDNEIRSSFEYYCEVVGGKKNDEKYYIRNTRGIVTFNLYVVTHVLFDKCVDKLDFQSS